MYQRKAREEAALNLRGVTSTVLFDMSLSLTLRPLFQLKVSCMGCRAVSLALQNHKDNSANDWNEVER